MKEELIIRTQAQFKASQSEVWDLLINPEKTKQYMFGCAIISSWVIGDSVNWVGQTEDGQEMIYVTGKLLEYKEGEKILCTTFDPNHGMENIPANHVDLSFEIFTNKNGTVLDIVQGDFAGAQEGQKRYDESKQGWDDMVIPLMKKLLNEE